MCLTALCTGTPQHFTRSGPSYSTQTVCTYVHVQRSGCVRICVRVVYEGGYALVQVECNAVYVCMYVWKVIFSVYCWYVHAYTYMCCVLPSQYMSHYTVVVYAHYSVPSVIRLSAMLSVATTLHSVAGSAPHGLLDFPLHHLERLAVLWVGGGGDAFVWGVAWYPVNALWVGGLEHTGWLW